MKYLPLIVVFVLWGANLHAIPKQADKPSADQQAGRKSPQSTATPQPSGPRTEPDQSGSNAKTQEPNWCQQLAAPLIANWPLIAVAIWGILVARNTLDAIKWQAQETANATKAMRD